MRVVLFAAAIVLGGCPGESSTPGGVGDAAATQWSPPIGAHWDPDGSGVVFRVASTRAERLELWIYDAARGAERMHVAMEREGAGDLWSVRVAAAELPEVIYYGYRVWGPNWPYDPGWQPGSLAGRIADVDGDGNRMNPNKLVFDPYARELSHDPEGGVAQTSDANRAIDSGPLAPKGIVLHDDALDVGPRPTHPLSDDVIYEVHLRGFTMDDAGDCRGTYAGAAARAGYLAELGVTAIEMLPIQETPNDRNDVDPVTTKGDNYLCYSTLAYFAPDRHYACDRSPGGPTREVAAMVRAFHEHGIKVLVDVVYNHTSEGSGGSLLSLRGIDNAGYYQLDRSGKGFTSSNGVGADLAGDKPLTQALVLDSLRYWRNELGVDGFRFDLAPILGNTCGPQCCHFDPKFPATIAAVIEGAALIAEPWSIVAGSYQLGNFPTGWSEWNDWYRDLIRQDQNQNGVAVVTPGWLADRIHGSTELYRADGRQPAASINYLVSHDGFTLNDLYACNAANNAQAWPYGPSDGGSADNKSWDHGGDPAAQRQAARTGLALLLLSQGVPMITGGDERLRTQHCNNKPYNLDSPVTWLDWTEPEPAFTRFTRRLLQFRAAHAALRHPTWIEPADIAWRDASGATASKAYLDDATRPVLAWQLAAEQLGDTTRSIYVAYNRSTQATAVTLPGPPANTAWYRVADTAGFLEAEANIAEPGTEYRMQQARYDLGARSLALFIAR
ncbi:glycogen debranching protein GlgX [soil metagenome]